MSEVELKPLPGYYAAKIVNYGLKKTKAGDPAPTIAFEVVVDAKPYRVYWQGSLKDGTARDITLKALAICGFTNVRSFANIADGPSTGLLDTEKEVQVTIQHQMDEVTGNKYIRVQWINESGGGKFKDAIGLQEAQVLIQGMGLEADFMRIAKENGYKVTNDAVKKQAVATQEKSPFKEVADLDSIPF